MREHGLLPRRTKLRSSKYLNNLIEQDHRGLKSRLRPMLGFKSFDSFAGILAGLELLRCVYKGQFALGKLTRPRQRFGTQCCRIRHSSWDRSPPPDALWLFAPEPPEARRLSSPDTVFRSEMHIGSRAGLIFFLILPIQYAIAVADQATVPYCLFSGGDRRGGSCAFQKGRDSA